MATSEKHPSRSTIPGPPPPATPAAPIGAAAEIVPAQRTAPEPAVPRSATPWSRQIGDVLTGTVQAVRGALPSSRVPVYLAGTALLVTGLVDPPLALGAGLAYEALRRWEPRTAR